MPEGRKLTKEELASLLSNAATRSAEREYPGLTAKQRAQRYVLDNVITLDDGALLKIGQGVFERYQQFHSDEDGVLLRSRYNDDGSPMVPSTMVPLGSGEGDLESAVLAWVDELLSEWSGTTMKIVGGADSAAWGRRPS